MCISSLKQFIDSKRPKRPANAYVSFPGFESLYVRHGFHNIEGNLTETLDLANIKASCPGNGAFSNLVDWIFDNYPNTIIFVENVMNPRFDDKLIRMEFIRIGDSQPYCYWKRIKNRHELHRNHDISRIDGPRS